MHISVCICYALHTFASIPFTSMILYDMHIMLVFSVNYAYPCLYDMLCIPFTSLQLYAMHTLLLC